MALKAYRPVAFAVAAAVVAAAAFFLWWREEPESSFVETTGVIEAAEAELSSKIAGRIVWLCCAEGGRVEAGAVVARLDAREPAARVSEGRAGMAVAAEGAAEARVARDNALAQRDSAASGTEAARAEVERARALSGEASENFQRAKGLFDVGYVSRKELDAARASNDVNLALLSLAGAKLKSAEANLKAADSAIRAAEARIATAGARQGEASSRVQVLEAQLEDTVVRAPTPGVISYQAFETGEYVSPGAPIYTIYEAGRIWARVDIEETRVHEIAIGARASVAASGGGKAFDAAVAEIGQVGGFATQRDVTRGRSDIKTFRVKVMVHGSDGALKPGMTVKVVIYPGQADDLLDRDTRAR